MTTDYKGKPTLYFEKHPNCTKEEFALATGSNKQKWYDARYKYKKNLGNKKLRSTVTEDTKFIIANPNATFEEFTQKFGNNLRAYSQARSKAMRFFKLRGFADMIKPFRVKKVPVQASFEFKPEPLKEPQKWESPVWVYQNTEKPKAKQKNDPFEIKEEHVSLGITPEFVWYESSLIRDSLTSAMSLNMHRFEQVVRVMESRHAEHLKMLQDVMNDNRTLRLKNRELTEMLDRYTAPRK